LIKQEIEANPSRLEDLSFIEDASKMIISVLEDNNINLYLMAVEVVTIYFKACLHYNYEFLLGQVEDSLHPLILRTNDTNTRVRKKSIEVITTLWNNLFTSIN